ncbi:MAG TPA: cytochrome c [Methylovirgula sp.]|jgi:cytochrome c oxidase cbb3-type subunit 3
MSSRFRIPERLALTLAAASMGLVAAGVVACRAQGPANASTDPASTTEDPLSVPATTLFPGGLKAPAENPAAQQYENNPKVIADGAQLFNWMNCSGCHFHGAGGIGPAFFNGGHFIYGGRLDQIYSSISQGRPNGMPSWQQKLPPQQIWALAAYVKALSDPSERKLTGGPPMTDTEPEPTTGKSAANGGQPK